MHDLNHAEIELIIKPHSLHKQYTRSMLLQILEKETKQAL